MKVFASSWQFWAVLSATFAALTAIFAKIGVENVNSDFATFIRSIVIFCVLAFSTYRHRTVANAFRNIEPNVHLSPSIRVRNRSLVALLLPSPQDRKCGTSRTHR